MQVIMGCLMRLRSFLLPTSGLKIMASQDNRFVQKNFQFADHFDWMHKQVTRKKKHFHIIMFQEDKHCFLPYVFAC